MYAISGVVANTPMPAKFQYFALLGVVLLVFEVDCRIMAVKENARMPTPIVAGAARTISIGPEN